MHPNGRQDIDDSDVAAVTESLRSDWLTTGPEVERFETAVAARAGVEHAVSVTSGTAALHVAYAAAGIEPGDEVVTTPLTFVAQPPPLRCSARRSCSPTSIPPPATS